MIDKTIHIIEHLLITNEHAVLPGFGGFVVQNQSAEIKADRIIPAHTAISFNPLMKHNDGMFIVELSRLENINYKEAAKRTKALVINLQQQLESEAKLSLGKIGDFNKDKKGNLEFSPCELADFLPQNIGLNTIYLPAEQLTGFSQTAIRMMRYAAVVITFIALFFSTDLNQTAYTSQADFSNLLKIDLPEIIIHANPHIASEEVHANRKNTENLRFAYKVVVATFQTEDKAISFSEELQQGKYPHAEILNGKQNTKVVVYSFHNIVAAVNYMQQIRHTDERFSDAWVMKVEI